MRGLTKEIGEINFFPLFPSSLILTIPCEVSIRFLSKFPCMSRNPVAPDLITIPEDLQFTSGVSQTFADMYLEALPRTTTFPLVIAPFPLFSNLRYLSCDE